MTTDLTIETIISQVFEQAKTRMIHPYGKFDHAKRWEPKGLLAAHCESGYIRSPSRAYPFSLMVHCRTKKFITKLLTAHNVTTIEAALKLYQWGKL